MAGSKRKSSSGKQPPAKKQQTGSILGYFQRVPQPQAESAAPGSMQLASASSDPSDDTGAPAPVSPTDAGASAPVRPTIEVVGFASDDLNGGISDDDLLAIDVDSLVALSSSSFASAASSASSLSAVAALTFRFVLLHVVTVTRAVVLQTCEESRDMVALRGLTPEYIVDAALATLPAALLRYLDECLDARVLWNLTKVLALANPVVPGDKNVGVYLIGLVSSALVSTYAGSVHSVRSDRHFAKRVLGEHFSPVYRSHEPDKALYKRWDLHDDHSGVSFFSFPQSFVTKNGCLPILILENACVFLFTYVDSSSTVARAVPGVLPQALVSMLKEYIETEDTLADQHTMWKALEKATGNKGLPLNRQSPLQSVSKTASFTSLLQGMSVWLTEVTNGTSLSLRFFVGPLGSLAVTLSPSDSEWVKTHGWEDKKGHRGALLTIECAQQASPDAWISHDLELSLQLVLKLTLTTESGEKHSRYLSASRQTNQTLLEQACWIMTIWELAKGKSPSGPTRHDLLEEPSDKSAKIWLQDPTHAFACIVCGKTMPTWTGMRESHFGFQNKNPTERHMACRRGAGVTTKQELIPLKDSFLRPGFALPKVRELARIAKAAKKS